MGVRAGIKLNSLYLYRSKCHGLGGVEKLSGRTGWT